jgi:hypothetical protein
LWGGTWPCSKRCHGHEPNGGGVRWEVSLGRHVGRRERQDRPLGEKLENLRANRSLCTFFNSIEADSCDNKKRMVGVSLCLHL